MVLVAIMLLNHPSMPEVCGERERRKKSRLKKKAKRVRLCPRKKELRLYAFMDGVSPVQQQQVGGKPRKGKNLMNVRAYPLGMRKKKI